MMDLAWARWQRHGRVRACHGRASVAVYRKRIARGGSLGDVVIHGVPDRVTVMGKREIKLKLAWLVLLVVSAGTGMSAGAVRAASRSLVALRPRAPSRAVS